MTKVSVIIPVYNVEKYLEECFESLKRQTLKDIEIICVDDGSTDNSLEKLQNFQTQLPNMKIITQKNKGPGPARNTGLKAANGEFVVFLDPDDYYEFDDNLECLYNACVQNDVKISGGCFCHLLPDCIDRKIPDDTFYGYQFEKDGIVYYKDWQFDYGYHRFLYNRKFLIENNLFFPDNRRFEDPVFFVRAMFLAQKFYALKKYTYMLRLGHKETKWSKKVMSDVLTGIRQNRDFALEHGLNRLYLLTYERFNQHCHDFAKSFVPFSILLKLYALYFECDKKLCKKIKPEFKLRNCLLKQFANIFFKDYRENNHRVYRILGIKIKKGRNKNG